ncbi:2-dehydropantoate 2-reductase [Marivirga tractuosa]|uniref:2-dehydropantoate 2-reductase n=1 Tax=Marivirga tractuosa (strain ATCC 23168 / DSM 4126 / NBRC 15989 / NCIMB 1408 / VKM B-1430 / H-43) TaxID=643867 RepID=E4TN22_MARTH|nr:2-dehydropantoate 2-reductase [Marivirga tractuosa]ADR22436.1 2-dehydropantoate 2-reductase [Marivirga tractuosa DSM 4126]BDD16893.1 2-dehydropantoate 2-reductase [Marivirga tractuosa]
MKKKHIAIIGLGGVGGYFGFKICQNKLSEKHTVSFVARGETYRKLQADGLTLLSEEHPNHRTQADALFQNIVEMPRPDLVLICVKEYDLENVCQQLKSVISEDTIILPMMNGADIHERIRLVLPEQTILPSCIYVASHIKSKGVVEHKGKSGKLILGRDQEHSKRQLDWVLELLENSKINYEFKDNSLVDIWEKFIFIASVGLVSAKYNSSIGEACNNPQQKDETKRIMQEIKEIADKKEIGLATDIVDQTLAKSSAFPYDTPTSIQLDINAGKKHNELELFAGAIIKYATALQLATPYTQQIYQELKAKLNVA